MKPDAYTHDSGLAGLGSGGIPGQPDVEKQQLVAELQRFSRAKRKRALRGRNHAEGYLGGPIETTNGGVRARSCAAQTRLCAPRLYFPRSLRGLVSIFFFTRSERSTPGKPDCVIRLRT